MMPLIAITREMGACGTEIAAKVAAALGIPLFHREVAERAASRWGVQREQLLNFNAARLPSIKGLHSSATRNVAFLSAELLSIAAMGDAIFRGWGAAQLFSRIPHALSVHVGAPLNVRIARMQERLGIDKWLIKRLVQENDAVRAQLAREYAGVDWRDPDCYDLLINTARSSVDDAAEEIITLSRRPSFQETPETRKTLKNLHLEALARAALFNNPSTRDLRIHVRAAGDELILGGIVSDGNQREEIIRTLCNTSPGIAVTSRLRAVTDYRTRTSSI